MPRPSRLTLRIGLAVALSVASTPTGNAAAVGARCFRKIAHPNGLSVCVSDGSRELRDMIGVRSCLAAGELESILAAVRRDDFPWTVARHKNFPTTDVETAQVPWIDMLLQPHLRGTLLPMIADVFQVKRSQLVLRDTFLIKYAAPSDASSASAVQSSLGEHWDESCFSFVVQLNSLDEFRGGGTKFKHASEPLSVAPGEAMVFCGYNLHEGVQISSGARYLLTGFVDLRAPPSVVERFTRGQPAFAGKPANHFCFVDFASPHLPFNVAMLRERYECTGHALLHAIAYSPSPVPYLDLAPLARQCDAWLRHGECTNEKFYRFLSLVIGEGEYQTSDQGGAGAARLNPRERVAV
jgi:hypothetical protein